MKRWEVEVPATLSFTLGCNADTREEAIEKILQLEGMAICGEGAADIDWDDLRENWIDLDVEEVPA